MISTKFGKGIEMSFYKDILLFFHEVKAFYGFHHGRDTILFNNKEIRIDGKPTFFWKEWFDKGIRMIKDLLDKNRNAVSFPVFQSKYSLQKTSFLHKLFLLFQVTS